jgi:NhaA family Na+:H+ antiporter
MLISGVHATIAGVLTAMTVPMRDKTDGSPLIAAEHALKPWVQFAIMPIFALVNAGVILHGAGLSALLHPIALGVGLGLVFGKPVGIMLAAYLACMMLKQRPPGTFGQMLGISILAGIGFTMSLFIGTLAFGSGDLATPVRFGVLGGSFVSALLGLIVLGWSCRKLSTAGCAAIFRVKKNWRSSAACSKISIRPSARYKSGRTVPRCGRFTSLCRRASPPRNATVRDADDRGEIEPR